MSWLKRWKRNSAFLQQQLQQLLLLAMLAVQLMLQGIPVELSPLHPLVDQLGLQIPSMKRAEALERRYDVICRTTVCVPRLRVLEQRTEQFNPADVLKTGAVALKP